MVVVVEGMGRERKRGWGVGGGGGGEGEIVTMSFCISPTLLPLVQLFPTVKVPSDF